MFLGGDYLDSSITRSYAFSFKPIGFSMLTADGTHSHFSRSTENRNVNSRWEL